jgi:hypothetical protein
VRAAGRLVIAVDGKAVRGAKGKAGKAPHLVAAHRVPAAQEAALAQDPPVSTVTKDHGENKLH